MQSSETDQAAAPARKDVITHLSVKRFLSILCGVWSLTHSPARSGAEFALRLKASETAARRIRYMLEHNLGMELGFDRQHEGHRGAFGVYVVKDLGIFYPQALGVIAQAHQNEELFNLPDALLQLGLSTEVFVRFLWIFASESPYQITSANLCAELSISKPTVARYLRIARNVFLMRIRYERFALVRSGDCFYELESWGIIRWERICGIVGASPESISKAKALNKHRDKLKTLTSSPW